MAVSHASEVMTGIGIAVGVAGFVLLLLTRMRPGRLAGHSLAGIGPVSMVTWAVAALALMGVGYHIFVHAMDLPQFRAPLGVAFIVAAVAVGGSLIIDAIETRRHDRTDDEPRDR